MINRAERLCVSGENGRNGKKAKGIVVVEIDFREIQLFFIYHEFVESVKIIVLYFPELGGGD